MANFSLWAYLTILTAVLGIVFAACAFVFVKRLEDRTPAPLSQEVGAHKAVLRKLRKRDQCRKMRSIMRRKLFLIVDHYSRTRYPPSSSQSGPSTWLGVSKCYMEPGPPCAHSSGGSPC